MAKTGTPGTRRGSRGAPEPQADAGDEDAKAGEPVDATKYPNLAAQRDLEKAQHVQRAMAMGVDRKQAMRHAQEDLVDGDADRSNG